MKKETAFALLLPLLIQMPSFAQSKGALETPANDSVMSGKYMFSGWVCDADLVEIVVDGGSALKAAYGTTRGDTQNVCGDSDNGFGLLFNMALLGEGEHEAILFADSQEIDRSTFEVTRLSTGEFLRDEAKLAIAYNFPEYGKELWLEWTESAQNFLITRELDTPDPLDVAGIWYDRSSGTILSLAAERRYVNRQEIYAVSTNVDPNSDSLGGVYEGYVIGDTGQVSSVLPEGLVLNATLRFSSTTRARVTIDSCRSNNPFITCTFRAGDSVYLEKLAGNADTKLYQTGPVQGAD